MKIKAAFIAAVLVAASATSAGSAMAVADPGRIQQTSVVVQLDECQWAEYYRCLVKTGDSGYCYNAAQSYECPPF